MKTTYHKNPVSFKSFSENVSETTQRTTPDVIKALGFRK